MLCFVEAWACTEVPATKSLSNCLAAGPWSIGTKWPALFTVLNYNNPTDFLYPTVLLFTFQTLNNVFLNII
jgi:hypothetical protein